MKRALVASVLLAMLALCLNAWAAEPVILLSDERLPFEMKNPDGSVGGLAADCVQCVLNKLDRDFVIKILPWQRAQSEVKAGKAHGFFSASRNDSRDQYAVLSASITDQFWNWYLKAGSKLDPLDPNFKISARTGSWFGSNSLNWLLENGYNVVSDARDNELLLKQLLAGRLDAAFSSNYAFKEAMAKVGVPEGGLLEVKGLQMPMGVYFAKKFLAANPGFLDKFNQLVPQCRK